MASKEGEFKGGAESAVGDTICKDCNDCECGKERKENEENNSE